MNQPTTAPARKFPVVTMENYADQIWHINLAPLYRIDKSRYFAFCENHRLFCQVMRNPETWLSVEKVTDQLVDFIAEVNQLDTEGLLDKL